MQYFNPFTYNDFGYFQQEDGSYNYSQAPVFRLRPAKNTDSDYMSNGRLSDMNPYGYSGAEFIYKWRYAYFGYVTPLNDVLEQGGSVYWAIDYEVANAQHIINLKSVSYAPTYYVAIFSIANQTDYTWTGCNDPNLNLVLYNTESHTPYVLNKAYWDELEEAGIELTIDMSTTKIVGVYEISAQETDYWQSGTGEVYQNGYNEGYSEGYATAEEDVAGTNWWEGYHYGYDQGLVAGADTTGTTANAFDMFGQAFGAVGSFMGTEILPNISIGTLIIVPTLVTMLVVIIRILKK